MLTRRSLLRGATGLAAAAPLSVALGGEAFAADGATVPQTLSAARGAVQPGVTRTPALPLTHLSVPAGAEVRLRTSAGWQPWLTASGCAGGTDADPGGPASALVAAGGVTAYQIKGVESGSVTELNTVDGPRRAVTATPRGLTLPGADRCDWRPQYLSRAAWGADESYRYNPDGTLDTPPAFFPVQTLTVHHSGEPGPVADPLQHVRTIYRLHAVENDWGDIGYQLLIDRNGRVYEGVYSDTDAVPVFGPELTPEGLPMMVNGAHVAGFNAGNIGVCVLGNTELQPPTTAAVRSLVVVLALLAKVCRLDPEGTTSYVNPISGSTATLRTISGHGQWHDANPAAGITECPGDSLLAQLPAIRRRVGVLTRLLP